MSANEYSVSVLAHDPQRADGAPGLRDSTATFSPPLAVVVMDAHAAVRDGLPLLLRGEGIEVLAATATLATGEQLVERHAPDVALVAMDLADADGFSALRRLVRQGTRSAVVLYTDDESERHAAAAMDAGAAGAVAKRRSIVELAAALRVVAGGGLWFNEGADREPTVAPAVLASSAGAPRTAALSSAELRVLALVADGSSTEEMADRLSLSPHTVRTHLRNVMRKLEASSRAHAVAIAIREAAIQF
jgi:DNA-binding NarL/FixJ family response regulator